ncbi:glycosyltransferase family 2 protein [Autumnicola psychrophila]|uniref:Glycosyltransferase family A protein n=1 Tax=Autumnicola psychrophila TaxID=3075592 RepID=A0ABU3DSY9_9FLAO|nr:glycosyltransferase family A protein [Zunongwangia sp. F225]MDT0686838.1 glycosyltransferase family A protein [Zunongwangia sp. F225]
MILLIHAKGKKVVRVLKDGQEQSVETSDCTTAFWEVAEKFPDDIIGWCEKEFLKDINLDSWECIFHHQLIMASYGLKTTYLPDSIGYVDQLPFININRKIKYPTWQMSTDLGGIYGRVLLRFKELYGKISDFGYFLNAIAKTGQQNGLFCYSDPALTKAATNNNPVPVASYSQLFSFVHQHYTSSWTSVLQWCLWKYEKKAAMMSYSKAFVQKKNFREDVDLSDFIPEASQNSDDTSLDVIIPTLGRKKYLEQVLNDLKEQILKPRNVIIIEQNPDKDAESELAEILAKEWPFLIIYHFTHKTGACNARNRALKEVKSDWIFFADDDIRLKSGLLHQVIEEAEKYQISAVNLNCKQPGEETVFHKVKQWGSFGAGTSMVKTRYAEKCQFSNIFEFGFGEDADFGMQLRNKGCDVIYHPGLQTLHLKAPVGGFREKPKLPWEQGEISPKPSPTLMAYAIKHYTPEQIRGYKVSLFIKFYSRQPIKNPVKYLRQLNKRWKLSEEWATKLLKENDSPGLPVK